MVLFHLGFGWAGGGYLGVDIFFVISGYLITTLLLAERSTSGTISLSGFWVRRARRLLPALFLVLVATSIAVYLDRSHMNVGAFRWDGIATMFYSANWRQIFTHASYFAQFQSPSPLEHTWSLAIEEQYYLVWPLLLLGAFWVFKRISKHRSHGRLYPAIFSGILALGSFLSMNLSYHLSADATSVYFSTQSRVFELLIGAILAIILLDRQAPSDKYNHSLTVLSAVSIAAFSILWAYASGPPGWMFHWGFLVAVVLVAFVIADIARAAPGPIGRFLALRPIRYIGRISYGIYLWHWPVIVFITTSATGLSGLNLDLVRSVLTLVISALSFHLVESPLRRANYSKPISAILVPASVGLTTLAIFLSSISPSVQPASALSGGNPHSPNSNTKDSTSPNSVAKGPYAYQPNSGLDSSHTPSFSPHDPLRVMIVGDSVMWTGAPAFEAAMQATGEAVVNNAAIPGWGLTTATNWRSAVPRLINQYKPQIVVGTWSWDNTLALGDPAKFRSLLTSFIRVLLTPGNGVQSVVFFQFPPLGPLWSIAPNAAQQNRDRPKGVAAWDSEVVQVAREFPGRMAMLDVSSSVEVKGRYSAWLPDGTGGWIRARMVDNTHFCPWGAAVYASAISTTMTKLIGLASPKGKWWEGSWTNDPRYGEPPGACPSDQPPGSAN